MPTKKATKRPAKKIAKKSAKKRKRISVTVLPKNYAAVLEAVKARIRAAQLTAALAVNHELVTLYWHIGKEIIERQDEQGWGHQGGGAYRQGPAP